jgi:DNA end-binding protein Ku
MVRPIWNGMLTFGLLNVPVQLFSAEKSVDLHFRLLDSRDRNPIRYERINAETGEEVPWKEIVKAFEYSKGNYVIFDPKELKSAAPEATETVDIEAFVPRDAINPIYFERPYYLVPNKKAEKGYVLLREVLRKTQQAGVAKVVIRTRQYLAALFPIDDALVLNLMRFSQEIVPAEEFTFPGAASKYRVSAKEIKMAEELIESMSTKWSPEDYKDDFRATLRKLVDARIAKHGKKVTKKLDEEKLEPGATTNVVDFMALLKKSLAAKERGKSKPSSTANRRKKTAGARS